jgi:serpin B
MEVAAAARDLAVFSMQLVRHLGGHHQENKLQAGAATNMALSPTSLHAVLSLLAAGATGDTRDQIVSFLGPAGGDAHAALASKVASYVLAARENVDEVQDYDDGETEVRCAMGVWVDSSSLALKPAFADMAASKYRAEARGISFGTTVRAAFRSIRSIPFFF